MNASLFSPVSGRLKLAYRRFAGSQPSWRRWHRHARPGLVPQPEALEGRTLLSRGGYGFTTLDDPNAGTEFFQGTYSNGINNRGQITGAYVDASDVDHGFLLSHGQYTALDDPNAGTIFGQGTSAEGINDPGQVAGYYADSSNLDHGFVLAKGQYATLDDPSAGTTPGQGTYAFEINNPGQIVGNFIDASLVIHGFLATPGGGDALLGASDNLLPNEAANNTASLVSVTSTSGANSAVSGERSLGQISVSVAVPLQGVVDPGVTLDAARASGSRLVFGLRTY
jgi:uncharacterized membrane protein